MGRLKVLAVLVLAGCGADYYDKAPPMPPTTPTTPTANAGTTKEAPKGPPFTLGASVPAGVERAAQGLYASCVTGDANACNQAAQLSASTTWGAKNAAQAARLFEQACDFGSPAGCENAAEAYENGDGVAVDMNKSWALRERACAGKRGYACTRLGERYAVGLGDAPRNFRRALEYLGHACDEGESQACQLVAVVTSCEAHTDPAACAKLDEMKAHAEEATSASSPHDAGADH